MSSSSASRAPVYAGAHVSKKRKLRHPQVCVCVCVCVHVCVCVCVWIDMFVRVRQAACARACAQYMLSLPLNEKRL